MVLKHNDEAPSDRGSGSVKSVTVNSQSSLIPAIKQASEVIQKRASKSLLRASNISNVASTEDKPTEATECPSARLLLTTEMRNVLGNVDDHGWPVVQDQSFLVSQIKDSESNFDKQVSQLHHNSNQKARIISELILSQLYAQFIINSKNLTFFDPFFHFNCLQILIFRFESGDHRKFEDFNKISNFEKFMPLSANESFGNLLLTFYSNQIID